MTSVSAAILKEGCTNHALLDFMYSCQPSAEHFEQCAEFLPSARRDDIAHCARQEARRYLLRRRAIDSGPFSSLASGRASRSWSGLHTDELFEIARVRGRKHSPTPVHSKPFNAQIDESPLL